MFNRKIGTISKKIHTPYEGMFGLRGGTQYEKEVTGTRYIDLTNAIANKLLELKVYGGTEQNGTPTPNSPVDIVCNNGVVKLSPNIINTSLTRKDGYDYWVAHKNETYFTNCNSYNIFTGSNISVSGFWNTSAYGFNIPCVAGDVLRTKGYTGDPSRTDRRWYAFVDEDGLVLAKNSWDNDTVIVAPENTIAVLIEWSLDDTNISGWLVTKNNPLPTNYIPYGQIYADGTVETVEITGKNLFDKDTMDTGEGYYVNNGVVATSTANRTIVINCKPNTKYSFWHTEGRGGCRAFDMSIDTITLGDSANWITQPNNTDVDKDVVITMTTSANAKKLYICAGRFETETGRDYESQLADLMVVEGEVTTATAYEPYFNGGSATAEMLLKVGDYQDVQSVLDGSITRNVGIKVLNGSESFSELSSTPNVFRYSFSDNPGEDNISPICSHYQTAEASQSAANMPDMAIKGHASIDSLYYFKDSRFSTSGEFKEWLASQYANGTPVIVVYPLATPTTETVTGQTMNVKKGANTIEITQASINNLQLYAKYKSSQQ